MAFNVLLNRIKLVALINSNLGCYWILLNFWPVFDSLELNNNTKQLMWKAILGTSRPNFLILAPLCVSVAVAYAHFLEISVNIVDISLCFLAAVLAHASVNMLNEYQDHKSGLDDLTQRTPFNGGSGTLQELPNSAGAVKVAALTFLLLTVAIGLYFVWQRGVALLFIGLLASASVVFYTPQINRMPITCSIAPGFGFGIAFVVGSFVALTGAQDLGIVLLALPIFLLTNNLLLLNQFPDKDADQQSGRRHLIIRYGDRAGKNLYLMNLVLVAACTLLLVDRFSFSYAVLLMLLPLLAGMFSFIGLKQYIATADLTRFQPFMALNVVAALSYPLILSTMLFLK